MGVSRGVRTNSRRRRSQRGQSLAEFAMVVPVFLILLFGVVDFSLGLKAWLTVTNASREGARVLVLGQSCTQVTDQARNVASSLSPAVSVTITPSSCTGSSGDAMTVTVSYTYNSITPLGNFVNLLTGPITMTSSSTMRHE
ncbi:MAG: pilus assembly protein [Chloroflexi bacterium]|nr:pilus assembly protein [Chloroflexota bacterium]